MSFVPKGATSLYIVIGVLAAELLLYGGMVFFQKRAETETRKLEQQVVAVDLEIERHDADRKLAVSFQRRLDNLQTLLDEHVYWTAAFGELEKYSLKTVRLHTLQVNDYDGVFVITGTVPTLTELGKYILGLRTSPNVQSVDLFSTSQSETGDAGYEFNAEIKFDLKLLQKP